MQEQNSKGIRKFYVKTCLKSPLIFRILDKIKAK